MKRSLSHTPKQAEEWPKEVQPGRAIVRVYRRRTPSGNFAFMVANYADGGRRFDSYKVEADAITAADKLAKRIDSRDYVAASMTKDQALEYATSTRRLEPFNVTVDAATALVAECLKLVGNLDNIRAAVKFRAERHKQITDRPVKDVVADFLKVKESRGASDRYKLDLSGRLEKFTEYCGTLDTSKVTTAKIQEWLDNLKLSAQSYRNNRTVLHTLFKFAVSRGYTYDNPVEGVEKVKVTGGDVEIFTPAEIQRLLDTAKESFPKFLPCLALGAFAGLRSAEIERLEWADIDLTEKHIVIAASKAKTASRRIVPIADNLGHWLADYSNKEGRVFAGGSPLFHNLQRRIAAATAVQADPEKEIPAQKAVEWKSNALRHSYASYRFAQTGDAGRVAGELGNSAAVIHRHYRELVKPSDAVKWFAVVSEQPANITSIGAVNAKR